VSKSAVVSGLGLYAASARAQRRIGHSNGGPAMRQSKFDKITAPLGRAEFALEELQKKSGELHRKREVAKRWKRMQI
jgi:hypothetical protein